MSFKFNVGDRVVVPVDIRKLDGEMMRGIVVRRYSEGRQVNPGNANIVYAPKPEVYSIKFDSPHDLVTISSDGYGRYRMQLESEFDGKVFRCSE